MSDNHIEFARRAVAGWPDWKKRVFGGGRGMTDIISSSKLLEWLKEFRPQDHDLIRRGIEIGAFDVATDADVAEIEKALAEERAAHNAHATELCLQDQEIKRLHAEIERLRSELCTLKEAYDDAEMRADDAIAERDDAQKCLDRALEALEKIKRYYGEEGYYGYSVANQALQSIRGGGAE